MSDLMLNDILKLSEEEIDNSKIGLNMYWDGKSHFENWYNSDENNRDVYFTYASHIGKKRNFTRIGQVCFGFVRLKENYDHWLLVSVGEITSLPESGACGHKEIEKYKGLIGRLIIEYHRGNKFSTYIFNAKGLIEDIKVSEILHNIYEPIKFEGLDKVHLPFSTLKSILDSEKYQDYKAALKGFKGVYCLTDKKANKFYIGSAYGKDGILQRWSSYIDSKTGGNVALINLYNKKGEQYFIDNFEFTIIESFNKNTDSKYVLDREDYWKNVFKTRENGYNEN